MELEEEGQDLRDYLDTMKQELVHTILVENHPNELFKKKQTSKITSSGSSFASSYQATAASGLGRPRRRSEEIDYFLTKKELDLDGLLWEDFRNTRLGHKIAFEAANKDRDIKALKEKIKALEDKIKLI